MRKSKIFATLLLAGMLATSAFASTSSNNVKNGSDTYGTVFINVKTTSIYAETTANSSGSSSSDYVSVAIDGATATQNVGASYTTAWQMKTGSFSGTHTADAEIYRSGKLAVGSTAANP